jgi:hypothetical protein
LIIKTHIHSAESFGEIGAGAPVLKLLPIECNPPAQFPLGRLPFWSQRA